ncbi:hypothetical protein JW916_05525 [Candidatus Sumerlaeota bacterium]|nr:hypothetical protein [Candidatus Sumerlaeota bacterium]
MKSHTQVQRAEPVSQDLHIHTIFSHSDTAVAPEQTIDLVAKLGHARVTGISDHLDCLMEGGDLEGYMGAVRAAGFRLGTELPNSGWVDAALDLPFEYFIYHCRDRGPEEYRGFERLVESGKPAIIAHPLSLGTDLGRLPPDCLVEINNRYVWRNDWRRRFAPYVERFRWVLSSDGHQPNWLNQTVAYYVASELGVRETLLFPCSDPVPSGTSRSAS